MLTQTDKKYMLGSGINHVADNRCGKWVADQPCRTVVCANTVEPIGTQRGLEIIWNI